MLWFSARVYASALVNAIANADSNEHSQKKRTQAVTGATLF